MCLTFSTIIADLFVRGLFLQITTVFPGNGFVYVKKDLLVNQDEQRAELETPLINSNKTLGTMTFWYLLGKGATTLDVYAKSPTAAGADQAFTSTVWSITLTHDNNDEAHWKKAAVTFCFDGPRSFVFRVTTLGEFTVAALDEVFTIGTQGNEMVVRF